MHNAKLTGIGCFAGPQTMQRLFKKAVESYALGKIEAADLKASCRGPEKEVAGRLLSLLLPAGAGGPISSFEGNLNDPLNQKITGFYLAVGTGRLQLSIFADGNGVSPKKYTIGLEALAAVRQKRLN